MKLTNKHSAEGFKRGLEYGQGKPSDYRYEKILSHLQRIEADHGEKLSSGYREEKVNEIQKHKLEAINARIITVNNTIAYEKAEERTRLYEDYKRKYADPQRKLADMQEAQLLVDSMDNGRLAAWAEKIKTREIFPENSYMILHAIKRLGPDHELTKEVAADFDPVSFTEQGHRLAQEVKYYATLGNRVAFTTDGPEGPGKIAASIKDIYAPYEITAQQQAALEMEAMDS